VSFAKGSSPILAVEYARRSIPVEIRPSFVEMETTIRRDAKVPPPPALEGAAPAGVAAPASPEAAGVAV
jgi:hypothetical protein